MAENGDAELDKQAQAMAEKALAALPEGARAAKIAKVKDGILKRLKEQAAKAAGASPQVGSAAAPCMASAGAPLPPPGPSPPVAPIGMPAAPPPPPTPPPEDTATLTPAVPKIEGVEALGDEIWFADAAYRRSLREAVAAAHAAQKILVGAPAGEIRRICPGGGRILGAGAVLRLGGATLGGYGEADIAYAYRQLSRALHPDKNPDIPEAHDAFKRLTEAADELRAGLTEARNILHALSAAMGLPVLPDTTERPQVALFAEATRVLFAVLGLSGEGEVPPLALNRGVAAFTASPCSGRCQAQLLLTEWYDQPRLLDLYAGQQLRTAYDCSRKRLRAQFLCALNRATQAEAKRHHECVRGNWQAVMMQFPEIGLWRELLDKIKMRVWSRSEAKRERGSMWDDEEGPKASAWAKTWRGRITAVLPRGIETATPWTDTEVRELCAALWKDLTAWARTPEVDLERHLQLFTAEPGAEANGKQDEWAYVPAADLLLVVGEGLVGITSEGLLAKNPPGHERMSWVEAQKDKWAEREKDRSKKEKKNRDHSDDDNDRRGSRDKDKSEKDKDREKSSKNSDPKNDPNFDWEQVWRTRVQTNRSRRPRAPSPTEPRRRSRSPRRRPTSRSPRTGERRSNRSRSARRRRKSRSRSRRRTCDVISSD